MTLASGSLYGLVLARIRPLTSHMTPHCTCSGSGRDSLIVQQVAQRTPSISLRSRSCCRKTQSPQWRLPLPFGPITQYGLPIHKTGACREASWPPHTLRVGRSSDAPSCHPPVMAALQCALKYALGDRLGLAHTDKRQHNHGFCDVLSCPRSLLSPGTAPCLPCAVTLVPTLPVY